MKIIHRLTLFAVLLLVVLTGCGNSNKEDIKEQQAIEHSKTIGQVFIDTSPFSGSEAEIIKLVNQAAEFQNKGDTASYFSLFNSQLDPNRKMPTHKISKIKLESVQVMDEQSAIATVFVTTESDGEYAKMYTFTQEDHAWKIADID
ncbi:hypothetical protein ACFSR7_09460 [Cohnella sp. GCM10020058]|uniref:hypothetical protein n=1 Tax=Cohnella sp. GCM10020058 TaxID=3317330 RepID=UPI003631EEE5